MEELRVVLKKDKIEERKEKHLKIAKYSSIAILVMGTIMAFLSNNIIYGCFLIVISLVYAFLNYKMSSKKGLFISGYIFDENGIAVLDCDGIKIASLTWQDITKISSEKVNVEKIELVKDLSTPTQSDIFQEYLLIKIKQEVIMQNKQLNSLIQDKRKSNCLKIALVDKDTKSITYKTPLVSIDGDTILDYFDQNNIKYSLCFDSSFLSRKNK